MNQLGDREESRYGFHGRAFEAVRSDGSVVQIEPVQTQGLFPAAQTTDPVNAPEAIRLERAVASTADGNGGVTAAVVNQQGQVISQQDGEGCWLVSHVEFNEDFLPELVIDCPGNEYRITYDERGNPILMQDLLSVTVGPIDFPLQAFMEDLALGDFNNDGRLDIAGPNGEIVEILLGNGDGTLERSEDGQPEGGSNEDLEAADLNGDGNLDLIGIDVNLAGAGIFVWLGLGDGSFAAAQEYFIGDDTAPWALKLADFNNDGNLDVLVASNPIDLFADPPEVRLLLDRGGGDFDPPILIPNPNSIEFASIGVGDVDGDGNRDFVLVSRGRGFPTLYRGLGNGAFSISDIAFLGRQNDVQLADVDGVNGDDVLVAGSDGVTLFLSNGDGTFAPGVSLYASGTTSNLVVGDLNGDGAIDAAFLDGNIRAILILLRNGDGGFARASNIATPASLRVLRLGDMNNNAVLDFVGFHWPPGAISVFLNDGAAGVAPSNTPTRFSYVPLFGEWTHLVDAVGGQRL